MSARGPKQPTESIQPMSACAVQSGSHRSVFTSAQWRWPRRGHRVAVSCPSTATRATPSSNFSRPRSLLPPSGVVEMPESPPRMSEKSHVLELKSGALTPLRIQLVASDSRPSPAGVYSRPPARRSESHRGSERRFRAGVFAGSFEHLKTCRSTERYP